MKTCGAKIQAGVSLAVSLSNNIARALLENTKNKLGPNIFFISFLSATNINQVISIKQEVPFKFYIITSAGLSTSILKSVRNSSFKQPNELFIFYLTYFTILGLDSPPTHSGYHFFKLQIKYNVK